jgi:hypothetical protein
MNNPAASRVSKGPIAQAVFAASYEESRNEFGTGKTPDPDKPKSIAVGM